MAPVSEKRFSEISPHSPTSSVEITTHLKETNDLAQNTYTNPDTSDVDIKAVRRKVDFHLIPVMFLIFGLQVLDKISINVRIPSLVITRNGKWKHGLKYNVWT